MSFVVFYILCVVEVVVGMDGWGGDGEWFGVDIFGILFVDLK